MLQQDVPDDYVIATGVQHSVREFVTRSAEQLGMELCWRHSGIHEKAYDAETGKCVVAVDPRYFRAAEVDSLLGDPSKAARKLGWTPRTTFEDLVREMAAADLKLAEQEQLLLQGGYAMYVQQE